MACVSFISGAAKQNKRVGTNQISIKFDRKLYMKRLTLVSPHKLHDSGNNGKTFLLFPCLFVLVAVTRR